jgi:hypothetical protein
VAAVSIAAMASAVSASAERSVYIGDQFRSHLQHPRVLSLWASDAISQLRWSGWGTASASASGRISTHFQGKYTYKPSRVVVSRVRFCGGRLMYTRLRYIGLDGRWAHARRYGCSFSA